MKKKEKDGLPFFGVGKVLPFMKKYRRTILVMMLCGLGGSVIDVAVPMFQRYSLNHFITGKTLDTLPLFILGYVFVILLSAFSNYIASLNSTKIEMWVTGICATRPSPICRPCPSPISIRTAWAISMPAS